MKHFIAAMIAVLFGAGISLARAKVTGDDCKGLNKNAAALAREYKELREKRRLLEPGKFDRDLSADKGRLHQVLSSLGEELGHPPHTEKTITRCLGAPDTVGNDEQMHNFLGIYNRELQKQGRNVKAHGNRKYLIYFWRGWHDFLFFISEDGKITDHGWWFAYE
jgi:hypothetical protein